MLLPDFIMRFFLMIVGYAYPAFQCFKSVEKNKVEIEELQFWCRYWIIMAMVAVLERITDVICSWFPFYSEMKLAFIIYLWSPTTKGSSFVYEGLLRPVVARHETEIDRKLMEVKTKVWDLFSFYFQNFAQFGQAAFFQLLQAAASQSGRFSGSNKADGDPTTTTKPTPSPSTGGGGGGCSTNGAGVDRAEEEATKLGSPMASAADLSTTRLRLRRTS